MPPIPAEFQPGALLYDAVMGVFRASGSSLNAWCVANGVGQSSAKSACYGQSRGRKGRALLEKIIDGAGRDNVRHLYAQRIGAHAEAFLNSAA